MRRFLKIVGIIALFATALSYFGFRIMFFDPFEGGFGAMEQVVPRDATFMVRRTDLDKDFHPFPWPDVFQGLVHKREWKDFAKTDVYRELEASWDLKSKLEDVERLFDELDPLDPMTDALGREVLIAGSLEQPDQPAWAVAFRASFRVKFLVDALSFGVLRSMAGDAIKNFAEVDGLSAVTAADGSEYFLFRRQDMVVAGNNVDFVRSMLGAVEDDEPRILDRPLARQGLTLKSDVGRPIDFAIEVSKLAEHFGYGTLTAEPTDAIGWQLLASCFAPESVGLAVGRLFLGDDQLLKFGANVDSASFKKRGSGLFSGAEQDLMKLYDFCGSVFPRNVYMAGCLRLKAGPLLRRLESMLNEDTRSNLNAMVQRLRRSSSVPKFREVSSAAGLLSLFGDLIADEALIALEPQEPYEVGNTDQIMVPEDHWGPRFAMLFPVTSPAEVRVMINALVDAIRTDPGRTSKVYNWRFGEEAAKYNFAEIEFADYAPLAMAVIDYDDKEHLVITTTGQFLREIIGVRMRRGTGSSGSLASSLEFQQAQSAVEGFGQGFLFCSTAGLKKSLSTLMTVWTEEETRPNWTEERRVLINELYAKRFPHLRGKPITPEIEAQLHGEADKVLQARERQWQTEELPAAIEGRRQNALPVFDLVRWSALTFGIQDDRELRFTLRIASALDFP